MNITPFTRVVALTTLFMLSSAASADLATDLQTMYDP